MSDTTLSKDDWDRFNEMIGVQKIVIDGQVLWCPKPVAARITELEGLLRDALPLVQHGEPFQDGGLSRRIKDALRGE